MANKSNDSLPITFEQLVAGYEFSSSSYELNTSVISKYLEAVGRPSKPSSPVSECVPPMAIAACAINAVAQSFSLPAGAMHTAQELEFLKLVPVGATINCRGRVAQKVDRGKLHLLTVELEARNQEQEKVLSGQATIVVPD